MLLVFLGLVSLIILPNALETIDFRSGRSFGGSPQERSLPAGDVRGLTDRIADVSIGEHFLFWGLLFIIVLLISSLLNPELRKKLLKNFIRLAAFMLGLFYLMKRHPDFIFGLLEQFTLPERPISDPQMGADPLPDFQPPQESGWISYLLALSLLLIIAYLLWRLVGAWMLMKRGLNARKPLNHIANVARTSLGKLDTNEDFEDFIIDCYARMSAALVMKRGLLRGAHITPSEFIERLVLAGLPQAPVEKLTRIFERVRYGGYQAGQADRDEAGNSLKSILQHCGEQS